MSFFWEIHVHPYCRTDEAAYKNLLMWNLESSCLSENMTVCSSLNSDTELSNFAAYMIKDVQPNLSVFNFFDTKISKQELKL